MSGVLDNAFANRRPVEEFATAPFAGGIMQYGYQCGIIWGASLSAGAEAYRQHGAGPVSEAKTIEAARRLVEAFRRENEHTNCSEITELDRTSTALQMFVYFLLKGGTIGCMRRAATFAKLAYREIEG